MMTKERGTLAIVGLGYVGLPLLFLAEEKGYRVIGVDIDENKVALLKERKAPLVDDMVEAGLKATKAEFTTNTERLTEANVIAICVPTPVYENHMPNLEPVKRAARDIASHLAKGQLIILESTVNPGVSESVVMPILEKESGLKGGTDFFLAHCPERINPGDPKWTVRNIPRVVGASSDEGLKRALEFYSSVVEAPIKPMGSLKEAEAVKVVENSFRDINIAFVNELAMSFAQLGIDVVNVIDGAATKPFAFMAHYPGCGVGGHCIPVDPYYLIEYAKAKGFHHDFLALARRINSGMTRYTAERVCLGLNMAKMSVNGSKVAVLGLSYKPNVDDTRESPSFEIVTYLRKYGANVVTYDPFVPALSTAESLEAALEAADAVVVATAHDVFKALQPKQLLDAGVKVVIDGRNCLDKNAFFKSDLVYEGVGRVS